jgi:hypothetical protein
VEEVENDCCQEISEIPLLEWIEDFESEPFTLVQSRKKKKSLVKTKSKSLKRQPPLRSKRTTPSLYRKDGGQENLALDSRYKTRLK